jgi:hypothetical protein
LLPPPVRPGPTETCVIVPPLKWTSVSFPPHGLAGLPPTAMLPICPPEFRQPV